MARKNKVDVSKKAEQAKAENLNQSQGVEVSAIVVYPFASASAFNNVAFTIEKVINLPIRSDSDSVELMREGL